jgi:predicted amino acid-binding ACT domain protein
MLVVSTADDVQADRLRGDLERAGGELGLDAISLSEVTRVQPAGEQGPSHTVSVQGADHPGIVHAVTSALAASEINVTDLETRLLGDATEPLYAMTMAVNLPPGMTIEAVESLLGPVRDAQGVELTIRRLGQ